MRTNHQHLMAEAPVGWCVAASVLLALTLAAQARADDRDDGHDEDTPADVDLHGPPAPEPPEVVARDDQGRVTLRANRLSEPFVLDGKLDDAIYTRVTAVSDFIQQVPDEGEPATEKTEAWVFFDDRNIYVGMRCWDSHPERMVVNEMRRDNFGIYQNESVTVVFDTFYDRRNGFMFQTNPLGALRDQQFGDEGQAINRDWNTVWDVKASTFEQGWIVEIAVPFKSLRYKAGRRSGLEHQYSPRGQVEERGLLPVPRCAVARPKGGLPDVGIRDAGRAGGSSIVAESGAQGLRHHGVRNQQ